MEIYELPITAEESRNYHSFIYKLKTLTIQDWIKAYITSVFYVIILCGVMYVFFENVFAALWFYTGTAEKLIAFVIIFVACAAQRSKTIQLRGMLNKYFINNIPPEFLGGRIQLKKIKVQKDRLVVYYRKFNADDFNEL